MSKLAKSLTIFILLISSCSTEDSKQAKPVEQLALTEIETTTTTIQQIEPGNQESPFSKILEFETPQVGQTRTGVVVPILGKSKDSWVVMSVCENIRYLKNITPIKRAHIVLDAGHGGRESGAVSKSGLKESELNLAVALETKKLLEERGARVSLTRTGDYSITVATRGIIAKNLKPGLFVSIHHNSGNPNKTEKPGTIVYTKNQNEQSTIFGSLFYTNINSALDNIKTEKDSEYQQYLELLNQYEETVDLYDQEKNIRDEILFKNGSISSTPSTTQPETPPRNRIAETTTTIQATAETTISIPEQPEPPASFEVEPVEKFIYSGGGNAGVRSWSNEAEQDYLGVLRNSGDVPAALVEFIYLSNPQEAELLADTDFITLEALTLADSITEYFSGQTSRAGIVANQKGDQNIGNSGGVNQCTEPILE